jgi:hypothetical protein
MRQLVRQGDVLIVPIDAVPANVTPVARENGRAILAHGEATGHAHAIVEESAQLVTAADAAELYLLVHGSEPVALTHDEHDTIMLPPGAYEVRRQREYAPEENRLVAD